MRKVHTIIAIATVAGILSGCASQPAPKVAGSDPAPTVKVGSVMQGLATLAKDDVAAAIVEATGPNPAAPVDPDGLQCFTWIGEQLPVWQAQVAGLIPSGAPKGALSGFEMAHLAGQNLNQVVALKVPAGFNHACAAWLLDNQATALAMLGKVGVAVNIPGAAILGKLIGG